MGIKANVGDVFLVPLDCQSWAVGQLISAWNEELYVTIFDKKTEARELDLSATLNLNSALFALTLDAKLFHGDWPILGNVDENLDRFPQPAFKVRQSGVVYIESRDRTVSRPASPSEAEILRYRSVSYPAIIEEAAQGYFGFCEWNAHFDKFRPEYAIFSSRLLNGE